MLRFAKCLQALARDALKVEPKDRLVGSPALAKPALLPIGTVVRTAREVSLTAREQAHDQSGHDPRAVSRGFHEPCHLLFQLRWVSYAADGDTRRRREAVDGAMNLREDVRQED